MSKIFSCHYDHHEWFGGDGYWAFNREKWFWLLRGIFKEYIKTKYYYGSVKKSTFSFSCGLQINKKNQ